MKKQAAEAAAATSAAGDKDGGDGSTDASKVEGSTSILGVGGKAVGGGKQRVGVQRTAGELRIQKDITELDGGSVAETGKFFASLISLFDSSTLPHLFSNKFFTLSAFYRDLLSLNTVCSISLFLFVLYRVPQPERPHQLQCDCEAVARILVRGALRVQLLRDERLPTQTPQSGV